MNNTNTTKRHSFEDIAKRTAMSFFLFAFVLVGLLTLSWYVLVPTLTHVEVSGTVRGLKELKSYKAELEADIVSMEEKRGAFLMPVDNDLYQRLKVMKQSRQRFQRLRSDLHRIVDTILPDQDNVVFIHQFTFDADASSAELKGEVRNVGPRSMTVLAQFVEAIHALPTVIDVETSRYTRKQSDERGFYSPFVLQLRMQ